MEEQLFSPWMKNIFGNIVFIGSGLTDNECKILTESIIEYTEFYPGDKMAIA